MPELRSQMPVGQSNHRRDYCNYNLGLIPSLLSYSGQLRVAPSAGDEWVQHSNRLWHLGLR